MKKYQINTDVGLLIVGNARRRLKECWNVGHALDLILDAFKGIPVQDALDILLGKVAIVYDSPSNSVEIVDIEQHPEYKLDESVEHELGTKVVNFQDFVKLLRYQNSNTK